MRGICSLFPEAEQALGLVEADCRVSEKRVQQGLGGPASSPTSQGAPRATCLLRVFVWTT